MKKDNIATMGLMTIAALLWLSGFIFGFVGNFLWALIRMVACK